MSFYTQSVAASYFDDFDLKEIGEFFFVKLIISKVLSLVA